jgi:hypothetical protein
VGVGSGVRLVPANTRWLRGNAHQTDDRRPRSPLGEVLRSIRPKRATRSLFRVERIALPELKRAPEGGAGRLLRGLGGVHGPGGGHSNSASVARRCGREEYLGVLPGGRERRDAPWND